MPVHNWTKMDTPYGEVEYSFDHDREFPDWLWVRSGDTCIGAPAAPKFAQYYSTKGAVESMAKELFGIAETDNRETTSL